MLEASTSVEATNALPRPSDGSAVGADSGPTQIAGILGEPLPVSPHDDYADAQTYLRRATWMIVVVIAGIAVSVALRAITGSQILSEVVVPGSLIALVLVVVQMRRRLSDQISRALEGHRVIELQNARLRTKRDALATQTEQLKAAATELEDQASQLEEQTLELEATIDELREAERLQRVAAAESALLARRLAEAQRVARLGYWEVDTKTGDQYWSDEMYALVGLDRAIAPSTDRFLAAMHPEDRLSLTDIVARAAYERCAFDVQYRMAAPEGAPGSWRTVQVIGRVVNDGNGSFKLVGTVQDITERVLLEAQLRRAQKMDAVGQLAGGVAHDFNNILTVIEGYSGLLLSSLEADDAVREDVEEIRRAAGRAASLTRQLLAFSRQQVLQPRVLDLNATVSAVEKMLRRLIGEHIDMRTVLGPMLGLIKADPGQLEQVIVNLAVNARDAMPRGGVLTIETANVVLDGERARRQSISTLTPADGPHVVLSVTDSGTGIRADDLERIFEPFFTTKESGKGTGLGLSTVHGIVEQSGGHIQVISTLERGTTFRIYFPRTLVEELDLPPVERHDAQSGSETILLVEDDSAVRTVASAALRHAGYEVVATHDGLDALRLCSDVAFTPHIVITDMVMPAMGGRELATHLARIKPGVPILFMSGYTRETAAYNAGLAGGESLIEKPFTPEVLTQRVRDALDRAATRLRA